MSKANDTKFELAIEKNGVKFYNLKNKTEYHVSRYLAAAGQERYSLMGITPELMFDIEEKILEATKEAKWDEIAVWVHNLRARRENPVDELCAIRMALIYHFLEEEDDQKTESHYTDIKLQYVMDDPELFSFFLPIGLQFTPSYQQFYEQITPTFLEQRKGILKMLEPKR
ncbi:MAG: hypothetical protein ACEQSR_12880 [Candidatus Methylacidiphilales bacterium]